MCGSVCLDMPTVDGQIGSIHTPASMLRFIQQHSKQNAPTGTAAPAPRANRATARTVETSDGVKSFAHQLRLGSAMSFVTVAQCSDVLASLCRKASSVFAPAIIHPAVALDESRLRFTITASHTAEDIDWALGALDEMKELLSVTEETGPRRRESSANRGGGFAELAASAEMLKEMMTSSGPNRLAIEADGCPKILIESRVAASSDSGEKASLTLRGDAGMLRVGSPAELIDHIASERLIAEGDISSLAWLCFAIQRTASAPRAGEYPMAAD
jgi:hypothetical protein